MRKNQASMLILSQKQKSLLIQIANTTTNAYRLVRRAKIILGAASGESNSSISRRLEIDRGQVRMWRSRWQQATEVLIEEELKGLSEQKLNKAIQQILLDEPRAGTAKYFSVEQVVQIVAIACETPPSSSRPVSHWTTRELASEAVKRGIVDTISPRSVGRFLKRSHSATSSSSLLAQCQTR